MHHLCVTDVTAPSAALWISNGCAFRHGTQFGSSPAFVHFWEEKTYHYIVWFPDLKTCIGARHMTARAEQPDSHLENVILRLGHMQWILRALTCVYCTSTSQRTSLNSSSQQHKRTNKSHNSWHHRADACSELCDKRGHTHPHTPAEELNSRVNMDLCLLMNHIIINVVHSQRLRHNPGKHMILMFTGTKLFCMNSVYLQMNVFVFKGQFKKLN